MTDFPPRPHDLLRIDRDAVLPGGPDWVASALARAPWVVVRRDAPCAGAVGQHPVGVRGSARGQRWASWVSDSAVRQVVTPPRLRIAWAELDDFRGCAALAAYAVLRRACAELGLPWGPAGSVGFELATGVEVATEDSDLDVVVYADQPVPRASFDELLRGCSQAGCPVDVQIQGPVGGFSASEYVRGASVLLRTYSGPRLVDDPWEHRDLVKESR